MAETPDIVWCHLCGHSTSVVNAWAEPDGYIGSEMTCGHKFREVWKELDGDQYYRLEIY